MPEFLDIDMAIGYIDENTKQIKATPYFEDLLYGYLNRMGGEAGDLIINSFAGSLEGDQIPYILGLTKSLLKKVNSLDNSDQDYLTGLVKDIDIRTANFNTKIKSINYTAKNKEYIEGRSGVTLKFPANAQRNDEVIFANGDGTQITFDGNGNDIKYTSTDVTFISNRKGSSYHFYFFVDNVAGESYWRPR